MHSKIFSQFYERKNTQQNLFIRDFALQVTHPFVGCKTFSFAHAFLCVSVCSFFAEQGRIMRQSFSFLPLEMLTQRSVLEACHDSRLRLSVGHVVMVVCHYPLDIRKVGQSSRKKQKNNFSCPKLTNASGRNFFLGCGQMFAKKFDLARTHPNLPVGLT